MEAHQAVRGIGLFSASPGVTNDRREVLASMSPQYTPSFQHLGLVHNGCHDDCGSGFAPDSGFGTVEVSLSQTLKYFQGIRSPWRQEEDNAAP